MMKQAALTSVIQSSSKQLFNATVSRIGDYTGDYIKQNRMSTALSMAGYATMIAAAPAIGIPAAAISIGVKAFDQHLQYKRADREARFMKELKGGLAYNYSRMKGKYK